DGARAGRLQQGRDLRRDRRAPRPRRVPARQSALPPAGGRVHGQRGRARGRRQARNAPRARGHRARGDERLRGPARGLVMMQRYDFELISSWIPERSRVLDLGCGDGVLLAGLAATRGVRGYGIEIAADNVLASVANGVNVIQSDLEEGLAAFGDDTFDFVILSQTLQAMRNAENVLTEMLRVGREGIV